MSHRLYVDEVGAGGFSLLAGPNERYLALVGAVMRVEYVQNQVARELEALKKEFFPRHTEESPLILHRKELLNGKYPFDSLRDPAIRARFDARFFDLLSGLEFVLIVVAIDKHAHHKKYAEPAHPYHYCMKALLERYVGWLQTANMTGDVLAEARGKNEDRALRAAFAEVVNRGAYQPSSVIKERLSSHELQVARKVENDAGLQVVDLVAHPCFKRAHARHTGIPIPGGFAGRIAEAMGPKIRRSISGKMTGYGIKWLP